MYNQCQMYSTPERPLVFDDGVQLATEGFGAPGKAQAAARPS